MAVKAKDRTLKNNIKMQVKGLDFLVEEVQLRTNQFLQS